MVEQALSRLESDGVVVLDDERRAQDLIQKLTDKSVADVDTILAAKEKELMEV